MRLWHFECESTSAEIIEFGIPIAFGLLLPLLSHDLGFCLDLHILICRHLVGKWI